jgi:hypothetical protein
MTDERTWVETAATEPAPVTVYEAISRVMADVREVGKGDEKKAGKGGDAAYKFRGVDRVMNAVGPAMRAHGVICVPHKVKTYDYLTVTVGKYDSKMASVRVKVIYRWFGPTGDHIDTEVVGEAFDSGDKATAKAMSVAYRTLLIQALTLPTGDQDPDETNYHRAEHDPTPEQERDLGRWRGEVSAAGVDRVKLTTLWERMRAEWETVPWSPERNEILQAAIDRARDQAVAPAPEPTAVPEGQDSDEAAVLAQQAAEWDEAWRKDLAAAKEARDAATVRSLIKTALESKAKHLADEGNAVLNGWRTKR